MQKIVIASIFIALLAGLGGGYLLGYVFYQPQLQTLRNDMAYLITRLEELDSSILNLNSTIHSLDSKSWHEVYSLGSSSDVITGEIQLRGSMVRGMWIASSDYTDSWFSVTLHFSNGTELAVWGSSGVWTATNSELELEQAGSYYLNITTYLTFYYFSFWDYY